MLDHVKQCRRPVQQSDDTKPVYDVEATVVRTRTITVVTKGS